MFKFNKYMQIHFPTIKHILAGSLISGALIASIPISANKIN